MPVKIVLDELSVQMYGPAMRKALDKGQVGMYRVYLTCRDKSHPGHAYDFLKWDLPKLARRFPHPVSAFPKLESCKQFSAWKFPMSRTKAIIEYSIFVGRSVWLPAAVLRNGRWQAVKLAWPRIRQTEAF